MLSRTVKSVGDSVDRLQYAYLSVPVTQSTQSSVIKGRALTSRQTQHATDDDLTVFKACQLNCRAYIIVLLFFNVRARTVRIVITLRTEIYKLVTVLTHSIRFGKLYKLSGDKFSFKTKSLFIKCYRTTTFSHSRLIK